MGNQKSQQKKIFNQRVVIVGFSYAGFTIAEMLWNMFDVTIIDQKDYFEHICSNVKCLIDENWHDQVLFPYENIKSAYQGKFSFIQATLTNVLRDNQIQIQKTNGNLDLIEYDFLILCTGFCYQTPIKDQGAVIINQREASLKNVYREVQDANKILIVGAGIVGTQVAGELAVEYGSNGSKEITICQRSNRLLPSFPPEGGKLAHQFLTKNGVKILYNTTYSEDFSMKTKYDLIIKCLGYSFKTDFMKENFKSCLALNGQIQVNNYMQITSEDPQVNAEAKAFKDNVFALGDICQTRLDEEKSIPNLKFLAHFVYRNLLSLAHSKRPSHKIPRSLAYHRAISLGPNYGISCVNGKVKAGLEAIKQKLEINELQAQICRGSQIALKESKRQLNCFQTTLCCYNCFCCCCDISNSHAPPKKKRFI